MPSEAITAATRPPFPTYLLPSFSIPLRPFRRRQSSTTSASTASSIFSSTSLSTSPTSPAWSANTTPSSSPPDPGYFNFRTRSVAATTSTVREERYTDGGDDDTTRLARTYPDTLKCSSCATDIAFASQIVSKGFTGRHGRAYLVSAPSTTAMSPQTQKIDQDRASSGDLVNTKVGRPVNRQLVTGAHVVADISCLVCGSVVGWKYVDAKEQAQRYKIGKFILETRRVVGGRTWEGVSSEEPRGGEVDRIAKDAEDGENVIVFDSEDEDECEDLFTGVWDAENARKRRAGRMGTRGRVDV